jgi:hypothetical protein
MDEEKKLAIEKLREASPFESTHILQEMELYDAKSSQDIINEVYEQFASGENMKEEILKPVFLAVVDSLLEGTTIGKSARNKGLTASRFIQECDDFSYGDDNSISAVNGYVEYRNARDYTIAYGEEHRPQFDRSKYENQNIMNNYKKNKVAENSGKKNLEDEYTSQHNVTAYRNNSDDRRNDPKHDYQAEADHIVPLKQMHNQLKGNYALSDEDIKRIANSDDNLALTSGALNGRKLDSSNSEFIKAQEKLKKEGKPYFELDEETKNRMLQMEKDAQQNINNGVNQTVKDNLLGKGLVDRQTRKDAYKEEEERVGRKLTQDERTAIDKKIAGNKQKDILGTGAKNAANQAKDYAVGNLILYIVKPIYYEISDIFKNGMQEGVFASSTTEALKIRFGRVKKYVLENAAGFLGNNMWEFVKGFVSSLVEGIISLFVGIFKQILKVIKEGIKIFVQAAKILFGKESKDMSLAEKGDAIIKLIGGSVIAISGIAIEALLNKIGIGEPWSVILSTMLSGIASALFMYVLDKADIFSVKAEKRRDRIIEIFDERIKDINEAADTCNIVAIETFKRQREEFETINEQINTGMKNNNINAINDGLYKMAKFMQLDLPYSNTVEFCDYMDSEEAISL